MSWIISHAISAVKSETPQPLESDGRFPRSCRLTKFLVVQHSRSAFDARASRRLPPHRGAAEVLIQAVVTSTGERVDIQLFGDTDRDLNVPRDQPRPK
jgi:hypothetical protein